jgi:hypothetical protein
MPDGYQGHWLSYRELAMMLGCTTNAARMHAVRRKWPRRASNRIGEPAHVLVPEDVVVRGRAMRVGEQLNALCNEQCDAAVQANGRATSDRTTPRWRFVLSKARSRDYESSWPSQTNAPNAPIAALRGCRLRSTQKAVS